METTAIILAAGQGKRMNSATAKQYLLLGGKPVLYYSLKAFQDSPVRSLILVVGAGEESFVRTEIVEKYGFSKVRGIVAGGKERYHSVYQGLKEAGRISKAAPADPGQKGSGEEAGERAGHFVLIHDGARPFVTVRMIEDALACVIREGACVIGMPVKDTIKIADEEDFVAETPRRSRVWMIQTPQVFAYDLVYEAYEKLLQEETSLRTKGIAITDDAGVVELFTKRRVKLLRGSYENIKITTPEDLLLAETFLSSDEGMPPLTV